jgi:hypothetical protein
MLLLNLSQVFMCVLVCVCIYIYIFSNLINYRLIKLLINYILHL